MRYKYGLFIKIIGMLLILSVFSPVLYAKTQYVTDVLYITLRTGPGDSFKVLKALKTGTKLEFIEDNGEGYSLVRTESGDEGWVRNKYLVDEPVARLKLAAMQAKLDALKKENQELKQKNANSRKKTKELEKDRKRLVSSNIKLENQNKKLKSIAARPMELAKENEQLKALNEANESQIASLTEENTKYKDNTVRDWFLAGGGVLLFGIILGLILPSLRWRKNRGWA